MEAASRIMEYLHQRGITQSFLARRTGIGISKLNMALNGKRRLALGEYEQICWALGVGTDTFLTPRRPNFIEAENVSVSQDL